MRATNSALSALLMLFAGCVTVEGAPDDSSDAVEEVSQAAEARGYLASGTALQTDKLTLHASVTGGGVHITGSKGAKPVLTYDPFEITIPVAETASFLDDLLSSSALPFDKNVVLVDFNVDFGIVRSRALSGVEVTAIKLDDLDAAGKDSVKVTFVVKAATVTIDTSLGNKLDTSKFPKGKAVAQSNFELELSDVPGLQKTKSVSGLVWSRTALVGPGKVPVYEITGFGFTLTAGQDQKDLYTEFAQGGQRNGKLSLKTPDLKNDVVVLDLPDIVLTDLGDLATDDGKPSPTGVVVLKGKQVSK